MSTVARGTAYEHACLSLLRSWLKMDIYRTGGAHDQGRDLCGWWSPYATNETDAHAHERIRVIAQCKAESRALGPSVVREMEGTLLRATWEAKTTALVGVMASHSGFSKQAKMYMRSSRLPLMFLHLATQDQGTLVCKGFLWNEALADGPLQGRFEPVWLTTPQHSQQLTLYRDGIRAM